MAEWKTVQNAPNYEVSVDGQVRNKKTGRILKTEHAGERSRVTLMSYGDRLRPYVADLVDAAFHHILMRARSQEIWRDVECAPDYQVSNYGLVRKKSTKRVLKPYTNKYGKEYVTLMVEGYRLTRPVVALRIEAFG